MKTLLNLSGFGWDEDKKMVTAEDRAHPDTAMYMLKCLPDYLHLAKIFGDSVADSRAGFASNDRQTPPQDNGGEDEIDVNATQDEVGEDHVSSRKRRNAALGGSSRQMTKRHNVGEAMVENVGRMADALDRMSIDCFMLLANELKRRKFMKDSRLVSVEEQLAIFLFTVGHSQRNRVMQNRLQHSGETISRYFNQTLDAVLKLSKYYLKPSNEDIPPEIANNPIFYPYFKDCVGAIDGTHIPAWVRLEDQVRYRNRKGKYYLVDVGYANTRGFLAPFRGVRSHRKEWSTTHAPRTGLELFNLRHSKLRNIVERTFAALKQRFALLQIASRYPIKTQAKIVVACCVLHNFIRQWNLDDAIFHEAMNETLEDVDMGDELNDNQPENNILGPYDSIARKHSRRNVGCKGWFLIFTSSL
ncbi:putative nuclease HARBI1 [Cinnamomum micranthum f. kanehirae]|uniref:Putative nuclease HARBI1 n=1 Tax=Cinnamomum micranthum f. kanehirae TaxID=337451 RepID=A0A443P6M7_9MAGN|nr:putative nuclease HARBI1 [Cinnamomum micranthum f. kanehirae]